DEKQRQLLSLLSVPGNDSCADCGASNPRWASWDLGIFLCVKCAQCHRSLGTHISKVKSLTLDQWTKECVVSSCQA
ncbi:Arf GTPase activating protein, partial [Atractiella rhizophila]